MDRFAIRCMLGSVQPGAANYCVDLEGEPEAREDPRHKPQSPGLGGGCL